MGWTARKSFKFGPTRINLSSRGIGYSVGVKGLRFGTSGGRGYVSAGRGMLRYRSSVGGGRASRAAQSQMLAVGATDPQVGRSCLITALAMVGLVVGLALLVAFVGARSEVKVAVSVAFLLSIVVGAVVSARARRRQREEEEARQALLREFGDAVTALMSNPTPTSADAQKVAMIRKRLQPEGTTTEAFEASYRAAVADAVADQSITDVERHKLAMLARAFGLSPDSVKRANLGGFNEGFYALIGDGTLTEDEDERLASLRAGLGIPEAEVQAQLAKADQMRRARTVETTETLMPIGAPVKLKKDEVCYHATPTAEARLYADEDFRDVKTGTLYVTNQRLLLVGDGTTTVKRESILQVGFEPIREGGEMLTVVSESRKTPYYFRCAEPYVLRAYVDRALGA